jgi:NAD(P)H-flavin reductase
MIKIYRPNANPDFPQGGKFTPYLEHLPIGSKIAAEGPFGKFGYKPKGVVILDGVEYHAKRLFFVAGGSGITPCYQTITEIIEMPEETIELVLLFANKTEADIVLRKELEALRPRLRLELLLNTAPTGWQYLVGHPNKEVLEGVCPLGDPETIYIHCGPPGMNKGIREMFAKYYPQSVIFKY